MENLRQKMILNWKSGLTVSLVAIPLSISLAVASGTTPLVGIITAIWAGLVASFFGGSNYNIVGPTGALSGMIAAYATIHGAGSLPTLTVVAGIIIIGAYLLRLERYLIFIPSSVINGFTLGVAFIIGFGQLNSALGLSGLQKQESFFRNILESIMHIRDTSLPTVIVFCVFLFLLFILRKTISKAPPVLILSPFGIFLGYLATRILHIKLATIGSVFGNIQFSLFEVPHIEFSSDIFVGASAIALVAILETMLSARIADGMTHTKHNERKEMFGLGLANVVSGLFGGIPATAALARTSLNVKTGATDKISARFSAIFLTLISFLSLTYFSYLPMSVIAAMLAFIAFNMVETEHFVKFYRYQRNGFWLSLLVAAVTLFQDPIAGIVFGTAAALLLFVEKLSHGQFNVKLNSYDKGVVQSLSGDHIDEITEHADILLYSIKGKLVYLNSRAHVNRFTYGLTDYKAVILRLRSVYFIDLDGAEALEDIIDTVQKRKQQICITSVNPEVANLLHEVSPHYRALMAQGLIFAKSEEALRHYGLTPQ